MKQDNRVLTALAIAIFTAGLFLVAKVGVRIMHKRGIGFSTLTSTATPTRPKTAIDKPSSPEAIAQLLDVYAQQGHPDLKDKVDRYIASSIAELHCAAVTAAGYLDDEAAMPILTAAFENPGLVDCALKGIGQKQSNARTLLFQTFLSTNKIDDMTAHEAARTRLAEIRLLTDENEKATVTRSLIGDLDDLPSVEEKAQVFAELLNLRPNDTAVLELARKELTQEKSIKILATSLGYLTPRDPSWLKSNLRLVKEVNGPQLQAVMASTLEQVCPLGWQSLLDKVVKNTSSEKARASIKETVQTKCQIASSDAKARSAKMLSAKASR